MRVNSYVLVFGGAFRGEPEIGIIRERVSPHLFRVLVGELLILVSRRSVERVTRRQRRGLRRSH